MKINKLFLSIIFLLVLEPVSATSVYRWVDEDGHVHFSSRPADNNAEEIVIKNRNSNSVDSDRDSESDEERAEKQKRFLNALDEENKSLKEQKQKKQQQAEQDERRCYAARDQLKRAENAGALYDLDEKGDRVLLNKEQYEQAIAQARARVDKWCN